MAVPENLCVKVPRSAEGIAHSEEHMKMAAYNTLGAIAMQGVRQADLRLGETCAVIGLGLLGQLTAILLKASGVKVVGIDIEQAMVELGREHCLDLGLVRDDPGIESKILEFSGGIGCDGVIITAASNSNDPINFAGEISRKKGTIVVVGAVPTGFDRDPHFYKKELTVKMSCSYGHGRYDPEYEEKGRDYPVGYVRWTEKRNMQAFQELIFQGKIDISYLTTHVFKLEDAPKAYDMIMEKSEPFVGILIKYDPHPSVMDSVFHGAGITPVPSSGATGQAQITQKEKDKLATDTHRLTQNENEELATDTHRHTQTFPPDDSSGGNMSSLARGKNFSADNKLNGITTRPLDDLTTQPILMVGYNRRFSPVTKIMKEKNHYRTNVYDLQG